VEISIGELISSSNLSMAGAGTDGSETARFVGACVTLRGMAGRNRA
jgi:hypothetical protein